MNEVISQLDKNKSVFFELLKDPDKDKILWKPSEDKWCLLEVVCHLYDEERDDFRFRVNWVLDKPGEVPPPFNPLDWVETRRYMQQDYKTMLQRLMEERDQSVSWLKSLNNPNWNNSFIHPKSGTLTAEYFLNNWLAHDYLHIRQILKLKFNYLEYKSGRNLDYAGKW